jgi:hypothetical protein
MFHAGAHILMGGIRFSWRLEYQGGDFEDQATSPNDPLFWLHHANLDRNRLMYMENNAADASVYHGFSKFCHPVMELTGSKDACEHKGLGLGDVAGALFPFSSQDLGLENLDSAALTHADILCHLGPATAPYTYGPSLCDFEKCPEPEARPVGGDRVFGFILYALRDFLLLSGCVCFPLCMACCVGANRRFCARRKTATDVRDAKDSKAVIPLPE